MWRNTIAINNVLKRKNYCCNPQCIVIHSILKKKKLQSENFNHLNIKKVKLTKIILKKLKKKRKK